MKTIEVSTTQNVAVKYELASPLIRFAAFLVDLCILICSVFFLWMIVHGAFSVGFWSSYIFLPFLFYTLICESLMKGATPGKKALGIRVMRVDGREVQFTDYLMRWIFRGLDIYGTSGALAIFTMISSEKYQRLGDFLANTMVVVLKKQKRFKLTNLMKFDELNDYEISYPQVRDLKEADVLLIKEVVDRYKAFPNDAHTLALETLTNQLTKQLQLEQPKNQISFLRGVIKDYVILTR